MRGLQTWFGVMCAIFLTAGDTSSVKAQDSPEAAVESVSVEKVGNDTYFRLAVRWPSEGITDNYSEFLKKWRKHRAPWQHDYAWPTDGLALIPQVGGAAVVVPVPTAADENSRDGRPAGFRPPRPLPMPAVFVGRLRVEGTLAFQLRYPSREGGWKYLPLSVDFARAGKTSGLEKEWLAAQVDFMSRFDAPADQSFFSYAAARFSARLGKPVDRNTAEFATRRDDTSEQLYEVTTGALALQESLQLDRMRGPARDEGARDVAVDTITGITVKSHPWKKMMGDKSPVIEQIASLVPDDQYYVRFMTTRGLADFLDFAEQWGGSVLAEAEAGGRDYRAKEKIERQICLKSTWISKLLGPAVIKSLAITGSDPYLREGSDISVIFELKTPAVFEAAVKQYLDEARRDHKNLKEHTFEHLGVAVQSFTTPDRVVSCYRVRMDDYFVYSNSPAAVRRIVETHRGQRASLAKSLDFVYMRTLYSASDESEDGFIFLSDAFIRALVGPRIRIAEKRRIEAVTSMEMIKNAALLYLWENPGAGVPTLEELYSQGFLDAKQVSTEPGDRLAWDPSTFTASSERYGRPGYLTPIAELDVGKVTAKEKNDYEAFRERYQNYWRRYFDPVGIRISTGQTLRLSMTILPLIDNSRYTEMQEFIGGKAVALEPIKREGPVVLRLSAHLNPDSRELQTIQSIGMNEMIRNLPPAAQKAMMWIGQRAEFWIEDSDALMAALYNEQYGRIFEIPIVLGVEVKNPLGLTGFLAGTQAMIQVSSPNTVVFEPTEPYKGYLLTRIRPAPDSWITRSDNEAETGLKSMAIYYGKIGRMLYISTSEQALHRIADAMPASQPATATSATGDVPASLPAPAAPESAQKGHLSLRFDLQNASKCRPALMYLLSGRAWDTEQEHLRNLWLVAHTVGLGPQAKAPVERVLGYSIESASGNTYRYDPQHDEVVGSATGSLWNPTTRDDLPEGSPLRRLFEGIRRIETSLEFTRDGLRTDLTIDRTGK